MYITLNNQPCTINVMAEAKSAMIRLEGLDPDKPNTVYFDRSYGRKNKPFSGKRSFTIPLPLSPKVMEIKISNLIGLDTDVRITNIELSPLQTIDFVITAKNRSFMEFAMDFCKKAGYLGAGGYTSPDETINLIYSNVILNRKTNLPMNTPAKVSRVSGLMEANRLKFKGYTIPMRLLILLHERMHYEKSTSDEVEADLNALRIYLSYGFPQTEAIYATANLFYDRLDMIYRVRQLTSFIKDFDPQNKKKLRSEKI